MSLSVQETVSALTFRLEERELGEEKEEESLPSALLEEKNDEIDHLTQEIHKLELELDTARDITVHTQTSIIQPCYIMS